MTESALRASGRLSATLTLLSGLLLWKGNTINPHLCAETERRPVKIARYRQRLDEIGVSRGYTRITAGLRASHCLNPQLLTGRLRGTELREDTTAFALRGF